MNRLFALLLAAVTLPALAAPFSGGDAETGKKLFAKYDCSNCHMQMLGGDGSGVFTRANRKVKSPQQMLTQMDACSAAAGIQLSPADKQHLGAYLNRYYNFK
jgi:cytochrome c2